MMVPMDTPRPFTAEDLIDDLTPYLREQGLSPQDLHGLTPERLDEVLAHALRRYGESEQGDGTPAS